MSDLLWESLADSLGTAATATLLRRAIRRAPSHTSWSGPVRILELDGHRVEVARDGPGDVELAVSTIPEVALIDIGLPGIDGYEVGRRIRAALGNRVLLVAVTAYGQEQDRRRTSEAGFDAHLVKPVSYQDLTRLLGHVGPSDA